MDKNTELTSIIEMLNAHCDDICALSLTPIEIDTLLHLPTAAIYKLENVLKSDEQNSTQVQES